MLYNFNKIDHKCEILKVDFNPAMISTQMVDNYEFCFSLNLSSCLVEIYFFSFKVALHEVFFGIVVCISVSHAEAQGSILKWGMR